MSKKQAHFHTVDEAVGCSLSYLNWYQKQSLPGYFRWFCPYDSTAYLLALQRIMPGSVTMETLS